MAASVHELVRVTASRQPCPVDRCRMLVISVDGKKVRHYWCNKCRRTYESDYVMLRECKDPQHLLGVRLMIGLPRRWD